MAGMNLFAAIAMALLHRERTGEGSEVGTSCAAAWSNAAGPGRAAPTRRRGRRAHAPKALANQYRTSDGRWIQLTIVREDKLWPELCQALERTDLMDDPRSTTGSAAPLLQATALLDPLFGGHPWLHWRHRLRHGITFGLLG
jgi:formyl-CoA transferase